MYSLKNKTNEIKSIIVNKNIKKIKQSKFKLISKDKFMNENIDSIDTYNYYVKLSKKLKRYLDEKYQYIIDIRKDKYNDIVWLVCKYNLYESDIEIPIDIRIISVKNGDTYMDCCYYNESSILYINRFESKRPNYGYGNLLLQNLDYVIQNINNKFDEINSNSDRYFSKISCIKGKSIPTKTIINQKSLNKLYKKYRFNIDDKNNIIKYIK